MHCKRVGNAIFYSSPIVEHLGFIIEFPPIGSPAMLTKDYEVVDYDDTPKEFWDAVRDYQRMESIRKLEKRVSDL